METSKLISLSREKNIGFYKKFQIKTHIAVCDGCMGFYKLVNKTPEILKSGNDSTIPIEMLDNIKKNIKNK